MACCCTEFCGSRCGISICGHESEVRNTINSRDDTGAIRPCSWIHPGSGWSDISYWPFDDSHGNRRFDGVDRVCIRRLHRCETPQWFSRRKTKKRCQITHFSFGSVDLCHTRYSDTEIWFKSYFTTAQKRTTQGSHLLSCFLLLKRSERKTPDFYLVEFMRSETDVSEDFSCFQVLGEMEMAAWFWTF